MGNACAQEKAGEEETAQDREDTARDLGGYHDCGSVEAMG